MTKPNPVGFLVSFVLWVIVAALILGAISLFLALFGPLPGGADLRHSLT